MKKIHILGLALFAVLAFSAIAAASAFAEDEFLFNGEAVTGTEEALPTETAGELELTDTAGKVSLLCSGIFDGYIGPTGHTLVTKVLNLLKEEELLPGTTTPAISCIDHPRAGGSKCLAEENALVQIDVLHLPWLDQIILTGETFEDRLSSGGEGKPAYDVKCVVLGVEVEVTCEGEPVSVLTNETGGILGLLEENETLNPAGTCSPDGGKAITVGEGLLVDTSAGTLTVS
jgi:hypothetical protein